MTIVLALALVLGQAWVWPGPRQWGYVTADPIREDRLGLALSEGRYSIQLGTGCDAIEPGQNVAYYASSDYSLEEIVPAGDDQIVCRIQTLQRMSEEPCFTVDGVCDIAAETD